MFWACRLGDPGAPQHHLICFATLLPGIAQASSVLLSEVKHLSRGAVAILT
jgi:hypothetical protein